MQVEDLQECLLDKDTRVIKQITVDDVQQANELFEKLMGSLVEPRREFISENSYKAEGGI